MMAASGQSHPDEALALMFPLSLFSFLLANKLPNYLQYNGIKVQQCCLTYPTCQLLPQVTLSFFLQLLLTIYITCSVQY